MAAKKALCVGINNYPGAGNDLRGCVNDANAWKSLLRDHFDFAENNINLIFDAEATKENILNGLRGLVDGSEAGDVLVFTNSSHGTYIADSSGDEEYDEAVCAVDVNILDDELREIFSQVPDGVYLTVILDNCHSGTGTRATPTDKKRFMSPAERGLPVIEKFENAKPRAGNFDESAMKEILLSGCKADEVSWDVQIGGNFHGAMTYCAIEVIKAANFQITYANLHTHLGELLETRGYEQTPQLEGSSGNKDRLIFS